MKTWVAAAIAGALSVGIGAPLAAYAGFDIDPSLQASLSPPTQFKPDAAAVSAAASAPAPQVAASTPPPTDLGPAPEWNESIDGFAKNQSPEKALKELVPTGGRLIANAAWPAGKKVSWEGNNPRMVVAKKILSDVGLEGTFEGKNLIVGSVRVSKTSAATAAQAAPAAPAVADTPRAEAPPANRLWTMPRGVMLSDGLQDWMEQTAAQGDRYRWTLEWDAFDGPNRERVDYKIVAPLRFTGQVDEAVADLMVLYRKAPKPLTVEISRSQRYIHVKLRGAN
ncbi:TcpQ domain-containing protein [Ralstonia sp. ASV6]|uniref:TcpQ domain-containing protein n=1 Tax=Ralstonia sp. ASV6 TaxID=2795124 RepID=UPI0018EA8831|nr:TcpQ domain-containing protein [Ralstonia sp. ASV6]